MWASTLLVSSPLAAHQVFLGGPHDAAGLSRGEIGRSSATNVCKCSVPIQALYIERGWSKASKHPRLASDLYVVFEGAHISQADKRKYWSPKSSPAASKSTKSLPVRGTRGTVARRHSWGPGSRGRLAAAAAARRS